MNVEHSSEDAKVGTSSSQQMDQQRLKRCLLISIGKVCILYAGLHLVLWGIAFVVPPFRPLFFGFHSFIALLIALSGLTPVDSLLAFLVLTLPLVGGCINVLVIGAGALLGGRAALRRDPSHIPRGAFRGGMTAFAVLVLVNAITAFCLWYFGIKLTDV